MARVGLARAVDLAPPPGANGGNDFVRTETRA